jgi:hypothetical protein
MDQEAAVWPLGRRALRDLELSGGLGGLSGKRIGLIWDYLFRGDEIFELVQREIDARWDDVEYVGWEAFGDIHGSVAAEAAAIAELPDRLREYRVDAALVGVGA